MTQINGKLLYHEQIRLSENVPKLFHRQDAEISVVEMERIPGLAQDARMVVVLRTLHIETNTTYRIPLPDLIQAAPVQTCHIMQILPASGNAPLIRFALQEADLWFAECKRRVKAAAARLRTGTDGFSATSPNEKYIIALHLGRTLLNTTMQLDTWSDQALYRWLEGMDYAWDGYVWSKQTTTKADAANKYRCALQMGQHLRKIGIFNPHQPFEDYVEQDLYHALERLGYAWNGHEWQSSEQTGNDAEG